jgi:hypothetical protein
MIFTTYLISYLELKRIEEGEFIMTMNGDAPCPINPMDMHKYMPREK